MSTSDRVKELLAQAQALEGIAELEEKSEAATAAYRDNPDDQDLKAKHRDAAQALADARQEQRASAVIVASDPGSVSVQPNPATGGNATQEG
jgi:LmbE family N-acetylglucosaminyl deacetylase